MSRDRPVRTRFAPSPTGYLHIGGVRTALFNWLYARHHGGQFVLRIDDTDQERNVEAALAPILAGFRWLGIDWDEGAELGGPYAPYYQSARQDRYREVVRDLVQRGQAYHDFASSEELQAERQEAERAGRRFVYSRRFMAETDVDRRRFEADGRRGVVRLKMPREGVCRLEDRIRGIVEVEWIGEQDHVAQRADGSCLYNLATVVDDHDMAISHVIRAEEHLSNTPRQLFVYDALGWERPEFAHLPFVAEPGSKNKLSKRKLDRYLKNPDFGALYERGRKIAERLGTTMTPETFNPVVVDFYRETGFLAEAVVNYLLLLGWALDDRTENFSRDEMIRHFSLERVNRAPASFDAKRLVAFQSRYMQALSVEERSEMALPYLERTGLLPTPTSAAARERAAQVVAAAGDRIEIAGDILDYDDFFVEDRVLERDPAAVERWLTQPAGAISRLGTLREILACVAPFDAATLEREFVAFCHAEGVKIGAVVQAVRVAVTGKAVGFGLYESLAILGRERALRRVDDALAAFAG